MTTKSTSVKASPCPFCGANLNEATSLKGSEPTPGALSVCLHCSAALVLNDDLTVRELTARDLDKLSLSTKIRLREVQRMAQKLRLKGPTS
jgi:hypothetical protein